MNISLNPWRDKEARRGIMLISPTLLWMIGLLIIPLILVLITSFGQRDPDGNVIYTFTFDNYLRLAGLNLNSSCGSTPPPCFDTLYLSILWRSVLLAFQTTALAILIGYPLAYFVARAPAGRRNLLLFLILVPLWTNFVIRIYAWIMILRTQGVLNGVIGWVLAWFNIPFEPLEKIDPALYEAAIDLGANAFRTFWRITLPLSMPGMVAGTILVFVPVMGTFIVSDILGGRQVILVGNLVQRQFLDARDPAFGSAASIILMVLTLIVTVFYTRKFGFGEEIATT
jgi:spermidine/putrescine transport system permease protein